VAASSHEFLPVFAIMAAIGQIGKAKGAIRQISANKSKMILDRDLVLFTYSLQTINLPCYNYYLIIAMMFKL